MDNVKGINARTTIAIDNSKLNVMTSRGMCAPREGMRMRDQDNNGETTQVKHVHRRIRAK